MQQHSSSDFWKACREGDLMKLRILLQNIPVDTKEWTGEAGIHMASEEGSGMSNN